MDEFAIFFQKYSQWYLGNKSDFAVKNPILVYFKNYSYEKLRHHINYACHFAFRLTYICFGFIQFLAIWGALANLFPHHSLLTEITSLALAFLPVLGPILASFAAHCEWSWNLFNSLCFFILPYLLVCFPLNMIAAYESYKDTQRWNAENKSF